MITSNRFSATIEHFRIEQIQIMIELSSLVGEGWPSVLRVVLVSAGIQQASVLLERLAGRIGHQMALLHKMLLPAACDKR